MAGVQARLRSEHQRKYPDLSPSVWYDVAPIFPGRDAADGQHGRGAAHPALDARAASSSCGPTTSSSGRSPKESPRAEPESTA